MTNKDGILACLTAAARPLTDTEIRLCTGIEPHQQVNQICRELAAEGLIDRRPGPEGKIVNSVPAGPVRGERGRHGKANADDTGRRTRTTREVGAPMSAALPGVDRRTLIVIPCSGRKRRGGTETRPGESILNWLSSILNWLPEDLAGELREARRRNAPSSRLDESRTMPAVRRYAGALYQAADGALERIQNDGAVAILSGGYGVVLGNEPIGWYEQKFSERMWPNDLVARCLAAYAQQIEATTVIGLLAGTTAYAKVFRKVRWPANVAGVWLVSPAPDGGGALVKVPQAIGEALVEIADGRGLPKSWTSSHGVGLRVERL